MLGCMREFTDHTPTGQSCTPCAHSSAMVPEPHADPFKVSIIIPAFNAASSIKRCLSSIVLQPLEGVEVIVVDDGSTDETAAVVVAVSRQYPAANIRLVFQPNQGVSVARNHGLALAGGRYVMFVDADDQLARGSLSALWARAEAGSLDILLCNAWWHGMFGQEPSAMLRGLPDWVGTGRAWLIDRVRDRRLKHYVWCQFIRREWLCRTGVRFIAGITHQDIVWTNDILRVAERVGFVNLCGYHYHQRAGSLSQPRDNRARLRSAMHYLRVARELDQLASRTREADLKGAFAWQATEEGIAALHVLRHLDGVHRDELLVALAEQRHLPLLWRNALSVAHRYRVLKRSARFMLWWAMGSVAGSLRRRDTTVTPVPAPDSQFGAD